MKRLIMHWTGGRGRCTPLDKKHYHFIVDAFGAIHVGNFAPKDNEDTRDDVYAAHTRGLNRDSIGVAICGMFGATEKNPRDSHSLPTSFQVMAFVAKCAELCVEYKIPVTAKTVLNHGEVEAVLDVKQNGKWDINWLPDVGWNAGNWLRQSIADKINDGIIMEKLKKEGDSNGNINN